MDNEQLAPVVASETKCISKKKPCKNIKDLLSPICKRVLRPRGNDGKVEAKQEFKNKLEPANETYFNYDENDLLLEMQQFNALPLEDQLLEIVPAGSGHIQSVNKYNIGYF